MLQLCATSFKLRILRKYFKPFNESSEIGSYILSSQRLMPYWMRATAKARTSTRLCFQQHCTIIVFGTLNCVYAWPHACVRVRVCVCVRMCLRLFISRCVFYYIAGLQTANRNKFLNQYTVLKFKWSSFAKMI